jgi:hypothetical protein
MAIIRVAPETIALRMFPGCDVRVAMIGFDQHGDVLVDLVGDDVPEGAIEIDAEFTQTVPARERVTLKRRESK